MGLGLLGYGIRGLGVRDSAVQKFRGSGDSEGLGVWG
jgi:hypothetical protein